MLQSTLEFAPKFRPEHDVKVNLKALAASLGLSQTTVSRALGGYPDVSETTRKRVAEAAQRLGYRPDPLARRLATGRTDTVGLVFPFSATEFGDHRLGEVVSGLSEGLSAHGMDLSIIPVRPERELETYQRVIDGRRVDALIVAWTRVHDARIRLLQRRGFPFLAYGRTDSPVPYPWFDADNEAGARAAAERLIAFGHRRIGFIHAPLDYNFAAQRHAGFFAALRDAGIAPDHGLILESPLSRASGYKAMTALLGLSAPPTAVLADNNLTGLGVLRAVGDKGLKMPRDISMIVYDGVSSDAPLPYTVTAVQQLTGEEAGHVMAEQVIAILAGKPVHELHHLGQPVIEAGDTDGPVDVAGPPAPPAPKRRTRRRAVS